MFKPRLRSHRFLALFAGLSAGALAFLSGTDAQAQRWGNRGGGPNVDRRGGQWGLMVGGSVCIPGKAKCTRDSITEGGVTIDGDTRPSFGLGAELGYRFNRFIFFGGAYNFGLFDTDYDVAGASSYARAYQNSAYVVVRPILPLWRFDIGVDLGPGFSRQTFVRRNDDKDYSQGFSFKVAPTVDIFITRRVFLGAKVDFLFNAHGETCREQGNTTVCNRTRDRDLAPVHQMVFGVHVGGTFL